MSHFMARRKLLERNKFPDHYWREYGISICIVHHYKLYFLLHHPTRDLLIRPAQRWLEPQATCTLAPQEPHTNWDGFFIYILPYLTITDFLCIQYMKHHQLLTTGYRHSWKIYYCHSMPCCFISLNTLPTYSHFFWRDIHITSLYRISSVLSSRLLYYECEEHIKVSMGNCPRLFVDSRWLI